MFLLDASRLHKLVTELFGAVDPLAFFAADLLEPLFVGKTRLCAVDVLQEHILDQDLNVIVAQHILNVCIFVEIGNIFAKRVSKLENVFGRESAKSLKGRLEVLVCRSDLLVCRQTTLLQNVVEGNRLSILLALAMEQSEALECVDINLVGFGALFFVFEGR